MTDMIHLTEQKYNKQEDDRMAEEFENFINPENKNDNDEFDLQNVSDEGMMNEFSEGEHAYVNSEGFFTNLNIEHTDSAEEMKAGQQEGTEKADVEKKRMKASKKMEKKAAKKAESAGNGHGIVFKTFRFVVCAAAFGVIALGTMYLSLIHI